MRDYFRMAENQTTVRTEIMAGVTTFLTMAYIIFLQPAILSGSLFERPTGMDFGAVMTATCVSSALATVIMALLARYPIAQAPGMGENFFFVFTVIPAAAAAGFQNAWQVALGVVFISGVLFLALSLLRVRALVIDAVSPSMKSAIAAGIGLFITFIGLQNAQVIVKDPGTAVRLNAHFTSPDLLIFFGGLILTAVLHVRRVRGSILWGILGATALALGARWMLAQWPELAATPAVAGSALLRRFTPADAIVAPPPSMAPTWFQMDVLHALAPALWPMIAIFLFMAVFDTIGTLIGVAEQAGFMKDNKLPRADRALVSDAAASVVGACCGTSTVTSYIESAAGVEQGGRTGLTGLVVAGLFLLALFFSPVVAMVGSYAAITAPALVIVGAMMMRHVTRIDWHDYSECIPAFLTLIGIPLTFSIADGLALGFIAYPCIKLLSGRMHELNRLTVITGLVLLLYFCLIRSRM